MFKNMKRFDSSDKNVFKYVFTSDNACVETVLYRYGSFKKRTVICCSVMSGCPVGCKFCGTGSQFIRNLTSDEIVDQIVKVLDDQNITYTNEIEKFQIMFMSMGEPMLNWDEVESAIYRLHFVYDNADLLLSTIGVNDDYVFRQIIDISKQINKVGLQFSIHEVIETERNKLIPFKNKMPLEKIRDAGIMWWKETGRKPFLNYCVTGENNSVFEKRTLQKLFSPMIFNFTFSVVCSADETMKDAGYRNLEEIQRFQQSFIEKGYNTRIFDPAGQDDIGGGCGQLWYVQKWMNDRKC